MTPDFERMIAQIGPELRVVGEVAFFSDRGSNADRCEVDGFDRDVAGRDGVKGSRGSAVDRSGRFAIVAVEGLDTPLVIPADMVSSVVPSTEGGDELRTGLGFDRVAAKRRMGLDSARNPSR